MRVEVELTDEQVERLVRDELIYHYECELDCMEWDSTEEDKADSKKTMKALRRIIKYYSDSSQWKKFKKRFDD